MMVELQLEEILPYGFALFFVFTVVVIILLRYSNRFLLSKISETKELLAAELSKIGNEMRKLVLANARERKELLVEIEKLKTTSKDMHQSTEMHGKKQKKLKAVA